MTRFMIVCIVLFSISFAFIGCGEQSQVSSPTTTKVVISGSVTSSGVKINSSSTPTSNPVTKSIIPNANISKTVTFFYGALESKNYSRAYSFLSSDATITNGQRLSWKIFFEQVQSFDNTEGVINDFTFIANSTEPTQIIMTITRTSGIRYHAHINLKQENNVWKIVQLDRI